MAILLDADRVACFVALMDDLGRSRTEIPLLKADLKAAIDAADAWISANSASYNTALPQPARAALTASQKAQLLALVILKRFERGA